MMLTVDSITGGNRERDLRTGFSIPFRLTLGRHAAIRDQADVGHQLRHPRTLPAAPARRARRHERRRDVDRALFHRDAGPFDELGRRRGDGAGSGTASSASRASCRSSDAKRAAEIGCTGIVLSNHGGRQLDGSRAAFDQLAEIVDAVGDRIDVMMDGGVQRGTHVLKALSLGAKAVGVGRYYLYPLAAAGQAGVERALGLLRAEIERGHEADGLHVGRPALARQSALQVFIRDVMSRGSDPQPGFTRQEKSGIWPNLVNFAMMSERTTALQCLTRGVDRESLKLVPRQPGSNSRCEA